MRIPLNGPVALRIRKRLSAAICSRYGSIRAYSAHLGEPYPSIRAPLLSTREFRLKFAEALCRDLDLDLWRLALPDQETAPSGGVISLPTVRPVACREGEIVAESLGSRCIDPALLPSGCVDPLLAVALDAGMRPEIEEGDLLLIDRDGRKRRTAPPNGLLALTHVGGRIVPRRIYPTPDAARYITRPSSPEFPPEVVVARDLPLVALGVIVGIWRR